MGALEPLARPKVLLVLGSRLLAEALAVVLENDRELDVVGVLTDPEPVEAELRRTQPDVVLVDYQADGVRLAAAVVAGFPAAFVGILFTSALLIEVIFSLDGLGLLGFEAALNRDYPVMFGTLYFFGLLGLLIGLLGDVLYTIIDPRIDFEARS